MKMNILACLVALRPARCTLVGGLIAALCACSGSSDPIDDGPAVALDAAIDAGSWSSLADAAQPLAPSLDAAIFTVPACKLGRYVGTFMCTYSMYPDGGAGLFDFNVDTQVTGDITLQIKPATGSAEFEAVGSGELSGNAALLYDFEADLEGTLDCQKGRYVGTLTGGKAAFFGLDFLDFKGDVEADYDGDRGRFDGRWTLDVLTGGACVGTWNAAYAGP